MKRYKRILIIHSLDDSTRFLNTFHEEFPDYYVSFNSSSESKINAKNVLGELDEPSLIVYIGHGSSQGLFMPNENFEYNELFIDTNWGNLYFENNDILLISCRSNEFLKRVYTYKSALGFGNIISSEFELKHHNSVNKIQKNLQKEDIDIFNKIYVNVSINIIRLIIKNKIDFKSMKKYYNYFLNKEIDNILLNKNLKNRVEIARLLFELRNELIFIENI